MIAYCDKEDLETFTAWELFSVNPETANVMFCGYCLAHGKSLEQLVGSMELLNADGGKFWEKVDDQLMEYCLGSKH